MKKILFFLLISYNAFAQVDRVEPPFWWADMNLSSVQIMFYGKNIAQNEISASNGIVIENVQKTENPNYVFVTIDTKNSIAQDFVFSFSKNKKIAFTQKYSLKARRENSKFRKSYDASDVIYLIMPDRFANGNPNNDSTSETTEKSDRTIPGGRHGGDIEGIIKNLDYLKNLGVTALCRHHFVKTTTKIIRITVTVNLMFTKLILDMEPMMIMPNYRQNCTLVE